MDTCIQVLMCPVFRQKLQMNFLHSQCVVMCLCILNSAWSSGSSIVMSGSCALDFLLLHRRSFPFAPWILEGGLLIATSNSPSTHQTFLIHSRSTDYGATYQKLNDKVGAKTILSYLYVSPNNKRKVVLFLLFHLNLIVVLNVGFARVALVSVGPTLSVQSQIQADILMLSDSSLSVWFLSLPLLLSQCP